MHSRGAADESRRDVFRSTLAQTGPLVSHKRLSKLQVSITYSQNKLHRPDMAMLNYGFLPKRRPPLLCAYDLGAPEAVRCSCTVW